MSKNDGRQRKQAFFGGEIFGVGKSVFWFGPLVQLPYTSSHSSPPGDHGTNPQLGHQHDEVSLLLCTHTFLLSKSRAVEKFGPGDAYSWRCRIVLHFHLFLLIKQVNSLSLYSKIASPMDGNSPRLDASM